MTGRIERTTILSIVYDDKFLLHDIGYGHPERSERLLACVDALKKSNFADQLKWIKPRPATVDELLLVHNDQHINNVRSIAESGGGYLDPDTPLSSQSYDVAVLSAGAWLTAVDEVLGNLKSAFVLSRPPGHHCEREYGKGFCLFSNCALSARYAAKKYGVQKIAIFDWDVHHGNGTQHILENDPHMGYCSIHQYPFYPGSGAEWENGQFNNVLNIPLPAGSCSREYREVFTNKVIPFLNKWNPELLIISAGFDAAREDPFANMNLEVSDYVEMTRACLEIAPQILLGLEGGYSLKVLADCTVAVSEVLVNYS